MTTELSVDYLIGLVRELCKQSGESEWLEFKVNEHEPSEVGEYISALANSSALVGRPFGYLVWGVANDGHQVVGTRFVPRGKKVGNEELENWLLKLLVPRIHFRFLDVEVDGRAIVLLEIAAASRQPVQFQGQEFVRIGSYKKKLKDYPDKARELWRALDRTPFENGVAAERLPGEEVLRRLDYPAYFELLGRPLPENREGILNALQQDGLIDLCRAGNWNVTNLGVVLLARRFDDWPSLRRKAIRVVQYRDASRVETLREQEGVRGYAAGFEGLVAFIDALLPVNEVIHQAIRTSAPFFPRLAVRELVANALIHQDFSVAGTGPMVEIFADRLEITNPGQPLMDAQRFLDTPPKSRNERLAALLRRMGICEERGSGWDKVVSQTELHQLPAPLAEVPDGHTRVVLFGPRPLTAMAKIDRVRVVYFHACLRHVNRQYLTNTSVRQRFGIQPQNSASASRLIREGLEAGVIVPDDPQAAPKLMRYIPAWARPESL